MRTEFRNNSSASSYLVASHFLFVSLCILLNSAKRREAECSASSHAWVHVHARILFMCFRQLSPCALISTDNGGVFLDPLCTLAFVRVSERERMKSWGNGFCLFGYRDLLYCRCGSYFPSLRCSVRRFKQPGAQIVKALDVALRNLAVFLLCTFVITQAVCVCGVWCKFPEEAVLTEGIPFVQTCVCF